MVAAVLGFMLYQQWQAEILVVALGRSFLERLTPCPLKVGRLLDMKINITQNGQPVTDLTNYLGPLGHEVVISKDAEQYLHVHPNDQADKGPNIGFSTNFEKPGRYRVFLQCTHGGQIHTGDFTINVRA